MELGVSIIEENVKVRYSLEHHFKDKSLEFEEPELDFCTDHPENNVRDIVESKNIVKECRIFPQRCKQPLVSNANMALASERMKLYKTERKLGIARTNTDAIRAGMDHQWKNLEQDETKLRKNFIEFNKFVRENYEKRLRATKKLEDDTKTLTERTRALDTLNGTIDKISKATTKMDQNIRDYRLHEDFLQKLIDSGDFKSISDIFDKYNDLAFTKDLLLRNQKTSMETLEHSKNAMMKLIEEKNFVIMGLNNQIANLQARYENANIKALESEELVTEIKNNAVNQLSQIGTVKSSIWNVYVHMASSKKHPIKIRKDNVEEQMMYINRTLTELSKVNKLIKKRSNKMK